MLLKCLVIHERVGILVREEHNRDAQQANSSGIIDEHMLCQRDGVLQVPRYVQEEGHGTIFRQYLARTSVLAEAAVFSIPRVKTPRSFVVVLELGPGDSHEFLHGNLHSWPALATAHT